MLFDVRPKHAQRYLTELEYRLNCRVDLRRTVYVALRKPLMPERVLKLRSA